MKKYLFPTLNGKWEMVYQPKIQNALPYIESRILYFMPVETVDVKEVLRLIDYIRINVDRDCTPEEVRGMVDAMKNFLIESLNNMPHHMRRFEEKDTKEVGCEKVPEGIVELIEADQMKKIIKALDVKCERSLDPGEASDMLSSVKQFMLNAVDGMEKYGARKAEHEGTGAGDSEKIL